MFPKNKCALFYWAAGKKSMAHLYAIKRFKDKKNRAITMLGNFIILEIVLASPACLGLCHAILKSVRVEASDSIKRTNASVCANIPIQFVACLYNKKICKAINAKAHNMPMKLRI